MLLVEPGILGLGIWNAAQGIRRNPTNGWNPKSKAVLNSITWGEWVQFAQDPPALSGGGGGGGGVTESKYR